MNKSYSFDELVTAQNRGMKLWELDTGTDGEDDILIGEREDVESDILSHFDIPEMPAYWSLTPITCLLDDSEEELFLKTPLYVQFAHRSM